THNVETARFYCGQIVTTDGWQERYATCELVKSAGMQLCCGGIVGMGETLPQRAELASQLAGLEPDEVPLNFLNPRPGTPLAGRALGSAADALRTIAAFRLALPRTVLRYAGGRELTLGDLGTEAGILGGINAIIVGNYLTTLGRPAQAHLDMLSKLKMPIKALSSTLCPPPPQRPDAGQGPYTGAVPTARRCTGAGHHSRRGNPLTGRRGNRLTGRREPAYRLVTCRHGGGTARTGPARRGARR